MKPRSPTAKKWTSLPKELCEQIREVFVENFADEAKNGQILVEGRIYPQELLLRVGYLENGRLKQSNFEISIDFEAAKENALQQIHLAVDCAASMLKDYFAAEQDLESFPREWKSFTVEKKTVYAQVTTINSQLEAEADRLLRESLSKKGENSVDDSEVLTEDELDGLVIGSDEDEDREAVITMLGLGDTDENDFSDEDTGEETLKKIKPKSTKTKKSKLH